MLGETIRNIFVCVVVILLLNVMEGLSVGRCALLECVCCACDPSVHLDVPSICFVCVCVCRELISSFRSLKAGSQVFALLMLFLSMILNTM